MTDALNPLSTDDAIRIADAIRALADAEDRTVTIAVADRAGSMLYLHRVHTVAGLTADISMAKAFTAASMGRATRALRAWKSDNPTAFVQLSALAGKTMIVDDGGVPVISHGTVVGGVGLSGGPAEHEHRIAVQALAGLGYDVETADQHP